MIGICKVRLADLAKGIGIAGDFDIKGMHGGPRGKVTLRLTVVDASAGHGAGAGQAQRDINDLSKRAYGLEWERDIVGRIARRLGRLALDPELMFGIFSRGTKSCSREDFKYQCL